MTKCPSKACLCAVLTVWQVLATLTLTVCCFVYLSPYLQIARLKLSRCRVESSFYTTQFICDCGWNCRSLYPCYLVHVSLNDSYDDMHTVGLYVDDNQQRRVEDEVHDLQQECTLRECSKDGDGNRARVGEFESEYGTRGKVMPCYYDPWDINRGALLSINMPMLRVVHAVCWPLAALIIGSISCCIFCRRCKERTLLAVADEKEVLQTLNSENIEIGMSNELRTAQT